MILLVMLWRFELVTSPDLSIVGSDSFGLEPRGVTECRLYHSTAIDMARNKEAVSILDVRYGMEIAVLGVKVFLRTWPKSSEWPF